MGRGAFESGSSRGGATERESREEAWLLRRVAHGDAGAFEALFRRYYPRLVAFFRGRTRDAHWAEELAQETLLVVWRRAGSFNGTCRPSTWVLGIAHRKWLEWRRAAQRPRLLEGPLPHQGDDPDRDREDDGEDALEAELDVEQHARREVLMDLVREALNELSDEHRVVMELTFQQGLSYGEIAQVLGIPPGTVKSRMFHAKRKLKAILERKGKGDALWRIGRIGRD